MKLARFIVDTHVHSQRHAAGKKLQQSAEYGDLGRAMDTIKAYDNSARLLYDMECYQVDMCVTEPAFGMTNEIGVEQAKKYPDKFVCNCQALATRDKALAGEIEWTMDAACEELDALLATGNYVGIGENMPKDPVTMTGKNYERFQDERSIILDMMKVMDVARKYKVPVRYHCGLNTGYQMPFHARVPNHNPLWIHDLAIAYPDVPIIIEHGGIEGWWWEHFFEACLHVGASHKNVYLETGRWWTELYYKALDDPGVGAAKLLWGTDWGASLPIYSQRGKYPGSYTQQHGSIVRHQVDIWGWSMKQVAALKDVPQDEINLIMGGNAVRLYNLKLPGGLTRMFRPVD